MLFVHMGSVEEGDAFFAERWPEARAVSDPSKELYAAFGLKRGTMAQVLGPKSFLAGMKTLLKGHGGGMPIGDPFMLSGWFLVHDERVVWEDRHEHAGAEKRYDEVARRAKELG